MRLIHWEPGRLRQGLLVALATLALLSTGARPSFGALQAGAVEEIGRQTSQIRGLELVDGLSIEETDPTTIERLVIADLQSESRVRELRVTQRLLHLVGLLPDDLDLQLAMLATLDVPVPALYAPDSKRLYLAVDGLSPVSEEKLAVAHELVHVLQDQNFGLLGRLSERTVGADRVLATRALVEGDAMLTMVLWGRQHLTPRDKAALGSSSARGSAWPDAPRWVRDRAIFPYREGRAFVEQLHRSGGFEAVDQALRNPPESTEQVLHVDRYTAGDRPRIVRVPALDDALGASWRLIQTGSFGELGYRILIEEYASRREAEEAAAGWGGDSYVVFEDDDGELVAVFSSEWDSEPDAAQLFNAYGRNIGSRFGPGARRTVDVPSLSRWAIPSGFVQMVKTDSQVYIVYAPTEPTLERVAAELG